MRRKLYQLRKLTSLFFLVLALRINSHKICAFIIWLNVRKIKKIKYKHKNIKKILFFSKSGGSEDLIEAFNNAKYNNIIFFSVPRSFLKIIFIYFFKKRPISDHFTKPINSREISKKNSYVKFLTSTFNSINKFLKLDGFISFNIFYYAEKHFEEVCKNLNKKFIVLHKENLYFVFSISTN